MPAVPPPITISFYSKGNWNSMRKSDSVKVTVAEAASCLLVSLSLVFLIKRALRIAKSQVPPSTEIPSPHLPSSPMWAACKAGPVRLSRHTGLDCQEVSLNGRGPLFLTSSSSYINLRGSLSRNSGHETNTRDTGAARWKGPRPWKVSGLHETKVNSF